MKIRILPAALAASFAFTAAVPMQGAALDFKSVMDSAQGALGSSGVSTSSLATSALSDSEVVGGLKEALANGVRSAINSLGQTDGFLSNDLVRIAVPDSLNSVAKAARTFGAAKYVDEFELTMNRAAEQAVPQAADIFAGSIEKMSIEDARQILAGGDDAATQYFRRTAGDDLTKSFRPIVESATSKAGVTSAYKGMVGQAGPMVGALGGGSVADLDGYVTNEAVDGLFAMIGQEERRIRQNPAARTSDLLKKVFQ